MSELTELEIKQKAVVDTEAVAAAAYSVAHATYYFAPYAARAADATDALIKSRLDLSNYLKEQEK